METASAGAAEEARLLIADLGERLGEQPKLVVGKPGLDGHSNGAEVIAVAARAGDEEAAEAQLARLEAMPRKEDLPPSEAKVREAKANLDDQADQLARTRTLQTRRAAADEDLVRRQQAHRMAQEQLRRAQAEHDLLKAGVA